MFGDLKTWRWVALILGPAQVLVGLGVLAKNQFARWTGVVIVSLKTLAPMIPVYPRVYLVAGTQEPFFAENAIRWADALRDAGADVAMTKRIGSHGDAFWKEEFPLMVAWALRG